MKKSSSYNKTCVALDLETTDLSPSRGDIIEVAAAKFKGDKVIAEFQHLTKPSGKIPAVVSAITGIIDDQVADAKPFVEYKDDLIKFVGQYPIVGHNINFDLNFLAGKDVVLDNPRYDTWKLATLLVPEISSHSLEVLTSHLKIKHVESHRALDDVLASKDLFLRLIKRAYEVDIDVIKEINQYAAKHEWALAEVFQQILRARRSKEASAQKSRDIADKFTAKKNISIPSQAKEPVDFTSIEKIFRDKEAPTKIIANYEFRPAQVALMKKITGDFLSSRSQIIGSSPGAGKNLAYLVAAAYAGKKISAQQPLAISVNSFDKQKAFLQDAEIAQNILPFDFSVALLEDRRRYLCHRRFEQFKNKKKLSENQVETLAKLLLWLEIADYGLFSELAWGFEDFPVEERINCDEKYCTKKRCPYYQQCFYYRALGRARETDVVVSSPAALTSQTESEEPPCYSNIIFDGADDLEEDLTRASTFRVSENILTKKLSWLNSSSGFLNIIPRQALLKKSTKRKIKTLLDEASRLKDKTTLFFGVLGIFVEQQKQEQGENGDYFEQSLSSEVRQYPAWERVQKAGQNYILEMYGFLSQLDKLLQELKQKSAQEVRHDISGVCKELYQLIKNLEKILLKPGQNDVTWLNFNNGYLQLSLAPRDLGDYLDNELLSDAQAAIYVSHAFSQAANVDFFRRRLGVTEGVSVLDDVYDYEKQVKVILPTDIPEQNQPGFNQESEEIIAQVAQRLAGRTVVSFSSKAAIKKVFADLALPFKKKGIKLLGLGISGGQDKVKQEFISQKSAVLLATHDFLLRHELPTEKVACLIVHKLPFGYFSDALSLARSSREQVFMELALPQALSKWQRVFQGLIGGMDDRGAFVVLDKRIEKARYGSDFVDILPVSGIEYCEIKDIGDVVDNWLKQGQ